MRFKLAAFAAAAFSLLEAQTAFAADMPTKMTVKAPMAAATPWTGLCQRRHWLWNVGGGH